MTPPHWRVKKSSLTAEPHLGVFGASNGLSPSVNVALMHTHAHTGMRVFEATVREKGAGGKETHED